MILDLEDSFAKNIIVPYKFGDRLYHMLFNTKSKGPFEVKDSGLCLNTLMYIGNIHKKSTDDIVGNIFFSQFKTECYSTFLLSYSGVYQDSINTKLPSSFDEIPCVLKSETLLVYHLNNKATIAMCPALNKKIKANLEI